MGEKEKQEEGMQLVVTADDVGYSKVRDKGIFESFSRGIVTRASLLVNGASATSAVQRAREVGLPLGLHLNLTEGRSIGDPQGLFSLLDIDEGCFLGTQYMFSACEKGLLVQQQVESEVEAQFDKFVHLTGQLPLFVDGHNHVHVLPVVANALGKAMQARGITRVRIPDEILLTRPFIQALKQQQQVQQGREQGYLAPMFDKLAFYETVRAMSKSAKETFAKYNVKPNADAFVGIPLMGEQLTLNNLSDCLLAVPSSLQSVELMVHPGYRCPSDEKDGHGCGKGPDEFSQSEAREAELSFLCLPSTRRTLEQDFGFRIVSEVSSLTATNTPPQTVQTVLILSSLTLATGNLITAKRLGGIFHALGFPSFMLNPYSIDHDQVKQIIESNHVRVVVGINAKRVGSLVNRIRADCPTVRVVLIAGGTDVNGMSDGKELAICEAFSTADAVVSFTVAMKNRLEASLDRHGLSVPRIHVIPQSFSVPDLDQESCALSIRQGDGLFLLLPCGIRQVKDPCFLVDAIQTWNENPSNPRIYLVVVGPVLDQAVADKLFAKAQRLDHETSSSSSNVFYHPPVPHRTMLAMMQEADAVVNTSENEGMSNALLEALALGKPVFARNNPGNASLLPPSLLFHSPIECLSLVANTLVESKPPSPSNPPFTLEMESQAYATLLHSLSLNTSL